MRQGKPVPKMRRLKWALQGFASDFFFLVAVALVIFSLFVAVFVIRAWYAHVAYGDWRCAMKTCVEVKETKP
jgi:hypothetical protein